MANILDETKKELINAINYRLESKVIERSNADLLIKLILNAESATEAISIAELGTTYRRTGFHFDKRLEKTGNTLNILSKNKKLSFYDKNNQIENEFIIGENYEALQNLLVSYKNKIDVIYIDPPYGKDSMGEFADTNYDNDITRDNLLSMLYPRVVLAKKLLSSTGVIYCSIDDRNQAYVKGLLDEIFGENMFLACMPRKTKSMTGDDGSGLNTQHDYLLIYSKAEGMQLQGELKDYSSYKNPDNDPKGDWTSGDPSARSGGESTYFQIENPITGQIDYPPTGRYWAFSKSTLEEYINSGKIKFRETIKNNCRGFIFKRYLSDLASEYNAVGSMQFDDNKYLNSVATDELGKIFGDNVFDYPKPVNFVKKIIQNHPNKNAIVLDFFAGSGTTGQAVLELNKEDNGKRKFILVQLPEILKQDTKNQTTKKQIKLLKSLGYELNLANITYERLKRVMCGVDAKNNQNYEWIKNNKALGGTLNVYDIACVADFESGKGKTPFDVIDETNYGKQKFSTKQEKIEWVCENFESTKKYIVE